MVSSQVSLSPIFIAENLSDKTHGNNDGDDDHDDDADDADDGADGEDGVNQDVTFIKSSSLISNVAELDNVK